MSSGNSSGGNDGDELSFFPFVEELDHAGDPGIQSVILADADVDAGFEGCSPLTDDDGSGVDLLAAVTFDASLLDWLSLPLRAAPPAFL